MKYLEESTDTPRTADVLDMELPLPQPGVTEHRKYFNHRTVEQERAETDAETGEQSCEKVEVPCADYVSVACDHVPSDEEWTECLASNGYDSERIGLILSHGSEYESE